MTKTEYFRGAFQNTDRNLYSDYSEISPWNISYLNRFKRASKPSWSYLSGTMPDLHLLIRGHTTLTRQCFLIFFSFIVWFINFPSNFLLDGLTLISFKLYIIQTLYHSDSISFKQPCTNFSDTFILTVFGDVAWNQQPFSWYLCVYRHLLRLLVRKIVHWTQIFWVPSLVSRNRSLMSMISPPYSRQSSVILLLLFQAVRYHLCGLVRGVGWYMGLLFGSPWRTDQ